jgi:selenocysteine-specific elongation factor
MRNLIVGTAGHVDHGKTSLIKLLTGIETDTLPEEKKRGLTIEAGFAHYTTSNGKKVGIVDVPGHEKFIKNMVAGAMGIDFIIFVVACDDGIMPQTREHLDILRFLNVKTGIIVLTKIDIVSLERREEVKEEVIKLTAGTFLKDAKIVKLSSKTSEGYDLFKNILNEELDKLKIREVVEKKFRIFVDRVFSINGFGTVITGTSLDGEVCVGDALIHYPSRKRVRVKGIQNHGKKVEKIFAGSRTALNLKGIEVSEIKKGDFFSVEKNFEEATKIFVKFTGVNKKNILKNNQRVRVHLGTREIFGRIRILDRDKLEIKLENTIVVCPGDKGILRNYSPMETIGGIEVLPVVKDEKQEVIKFEKILKIKLNRFEKKMKEEILDFYKKKRFSSTLFSEIEKYFSHQKEFKEIHKYLVREGLIISIAKDIFIMRGFLKEAEKRLREKIKTSSRILLSEFRDLLGISRKEALHILEYFDKKQITLRIEEYRILK